MRLPEWLRTRDYRAVGRSVEVTLELDATGFVDAMYRAHEAASNAALARAIRYERSLGKAQVGVLLDQMCRDYGWDPVTVWRLPRMESS